MTIRVLLADDEEVLRKVYTAVLKDAGLRVETAVDGFDALLQMKKAVPDVLVSDLNMPKMSGFELLSVVRRRFPMVAVLAMSGAAYSKNAAPTGIISDGFFSKSGDFKIADAIQEVYALKNSPGFRREHLGNAPVWIPRNGRDSSGTPYIVLTCTECLRSFPVDVLEDNPTHEVRTTPCIFCDSAVTYIIDFSIGLALDHVNQKKSA